MPAMEKFISQAPLQPGAAAEVDLYVCPAGFEAAISSIVVCNTGTAPAKFRVRKAKSGAATALNQSLYHDQYIGPSETFVLNLNETLTQTDKLRVQSDTGNCVFDVNGTEIQ